jgi:hypothetical protein
MGPHYFDLTLDFFATAGCFGQEDYKKEEKPLRSPQAFSTFHSSVGLAAIDAGAIGVYQTLRVSPTG